MKKVFRFFGIIALAAAIGFSMAGCDDGNGTTTKSSAKAITAFSINGIEGDIDEAAKTVAVTVPNGTDVTAIAPSVTVSANADYSPKGEQDFTDPVEYTVTAEDGSSQKYTVTVTAAQLNSNAAVKIGAAEYETLEDAIDAIADNGTGIITVVANITAPGGGYDIDDGKTITIVADSTDRTITLGEEGRLFRVRSGSKLILGGGSTGTLTLSGLGASVTNTSTLAYVQGELELNDKVIITDNNNSGDGGGVYVYGGTFTMKGGTISGNSALGGGGIAVDQSGTFNMQGGTISGNSAINDGGGVSVFNTSTFTMSGGYIYGTDGSAYDPPGDPNTAPTAAAVIIVIGSTAAYGGDYGSGTITSTDNTLPIHGN